MVRDICIDTPQIQFKLAQLLNRICTCTFNIYGGVFNVL